MRSPQVNKPKPNLIMNNLSVGFPAMPDGADKNITQPSAQFKKSTYKVIAAITLFVVVYLLLLATAMAIAAAMCWLGVMIMVNVSSFLVIILGLGLILSGIMLSFFLIKFIFTKKQKKVPGFQITEKEQPELFDFIRKVTQEVGTSDPRHVYLSCEVNASASFNPNFWSLFLPIKKDLTIGLGIVNALNQSEFKAVLAHEFGHFSQRSMRFGGYVHHLNRAIYNLLYENAGYHKALNAWGRWHWMLRFAATINVYIIRCMQYILRKVYLFINKSHLELSRQMEFHADTIAAYASGGNNMSSTLRRLQVAQECYDQIFPIINARLSENLRPANMYQLQSWLLKQYALNHDLQTDKNGVPVIGATAIINYSQITIDSQWASHPQIEDREKYFGQFGLHAPVIQEPAWKLFRNGEQLQRQFTDQLYQDVDKKDELVIAELSVFEQSLEKEKEACRHDGRYRGYYDDRMLTVFNLDELSAEKGDDSSEHFDALFSKEHSILPKQIDAIRMDIIKLQSVMESNSDDIRSFEYKGVKYYPKDAPGISALLAAELKENEARLGDLDRDIFRTFYKAARTAELKKELLRLHEKAFKYQREAAIDFGNCNRMVGLVRPVYAQMSYSNIYATVNKIYDLEREIKPRMTQVLSQVVTKPFIDEAQKALLDNYLLNNWVYFLEPKYDSNALNALNNGLNTYVEVLVRRNFQFKNELLNFQLSLLDDH
jgi:Zn-dependent protease with chaperone function